MKIFVDELTDVKNRVVDQRKFSEPLLTWNAVNSLKHLNRGVAAQADFSVGSEKSDF